MKRILGIVTVGRSDYGIYTPIIRTIAGYGDLEPHVYISGAHLDPKFGNTVDEVEKSGVPIAAKVPAGIIGNSPVDIAQAMGRITQGFARIFCDNAPDILLVLGDRFEMHAAAVAAIPFRIPLAHIHGGEITYGAIDEYFRHSLTKLSSLHFAATESYAKRIIQMGEEPWRVVISGAPGLDAVSTIPRLTKDELTRSFGVDFSKPVILVTFHPVTTSFEHTATYMDNLLTALARVDNTHIVFSYPNTDMGHEVIIERIESFVRTHRQTRVVKNFGHQGYLSMMAHAVAMVGNSSSGIIEAASFKLPVVNIGTRQQGRVRGVNVIDVTYDPGEIVVGIQKALSPAFRATLVDLLNSYGDGYASERIVSTLATVDLRRLISKRFHDIVGNIP